MELNYRAMVSFVLYCLPKQVLVSCDCATKAAALDSATVEQANTFLIKWQHVTATDQLNFCAASIIKCLHV